MKIYVIDGDGEKHELEGDVDTPLMEVIRDADLPIRAECGGCCACATCHVFVDEAFLAKTGEQSEDEADLLNDSPDVEDNSRLSCQVILTEAMDGMTVTLAPDALA